MLPMLLFSLVLTTVHVLHEIKHMIFLKFKLIAVSQQHNVDCKSTQ